MGQSNDFPSLDPSINNQLSHVGKGSNVNDNAYPTDHLDTPNNSPDFTPPGTPPSYYGAFDLLQEGAKMI